MIKDPTTYSWLTYLWVGILSTWGGAIRYFNSIKDREQKITVCQFLYEFSLNCSTSAFVGVTTFFFCEASGFNPLLTAACVAITGHMGAEALSILRKKIGW